MKSRRDPPRTCRDRGDFRRAPEPRDGSGARPPAEDADGIFVVHQHRARSEHFDWRLEVDGALASWAVPKGPSTDPRERRLAVRTEDHPLEYADFEGVIPEGEYGAGAVIVWDAGPIWNRSTDDGGGALPLRDALARGSLEVWLEGRKLRGAWTLVHARVGGDSRNWLLAKRDDEGADARRRPTRTEPESVLSGRTIDQVAEEGARGEGPEA